MAIRKDIARNHFLTGALSKIAASPQMASSAATVRKAVWSPRIFFLILFALIARAGFGQGVQEITRAEFKEARRVKDATGVAAQSANRTAAGAPITNEVNKGVDFGVSLGFNTVFDKLYEARISPLDSKLKISSIPRAAFLLSTGVSFPLRSAKAEAAGRYYRKLNTDGTPSGTVNYVPYGWCILATVNLLTFNSGATGSAFNQKIDGGLGLGYRINDNVQVAATVEFISYRQPRDFLLNDYPDKELKNAAGTLLTTLSPDDNDYFRDRYLPSVSLKLFYLIAYKPNE